jgi:hypothetical protein
VLQGRLANLPKTIPAMTPAPPAIKQGWVGGPRAQTGLIHNL